MGRVMKFKFTCTLFLLLSFSCATARENRTTAAAAKSIHENIVLLAPELSKFMGNGPFAIEEQNDREVTLTLSEKVAVDYFSPVTSDKAPLVIICHGNFSGKGAHRSQARMLATWGFNVVTFEVPNRDQWLQNGQRLNTFINFLYNSPKFLGAAVDVERMIVVGHSFGGSASTLAISMGAPVVGAVLLDPAVVHKNVVKAMRNANAPIALLGSDKKLFQARGRSSFFKNVRGEMLEVSVTGAVHDDAQGPSMFSRSSLGVDPFTSLDNQATFRSLLTASVISLSSSGTLDFAASVIKKESRKGLISEFARRAPLDQAH